MDLSDEGEIKDDDFSDISEEEYFDTIANKIEKRKLELELLNQLAYDDYAKENRYENHRNRQIPSTSRRNNNNNINNNSSNSFRKEKPRKYSEVRHRSYRASSVFSTSYTLPKRKRQRKRRKYSKIQSPVFLSSDESIVPVINNESDEDEELLALRLQALTSKQEVKELIDEPTPVDSKIQPKTPASSPILMQNINNTNEDEEQLRIDALKSAIIKKKDHFRKRKQQKKLENERPYSPTDNFEPIVDVAMDLSNSPLGSPFHETLCDMNEEIDMDISKSPPQTENNDLEDNRETCDMEIVCSPQPQKASEIESENEEEIALRTMLLSSINGNNNKKKQDDDSQKVSENEQDISAPSSPQSLIAKNLKIAVERIKQQKQQAQPIVSSQKSGTKTIKMILEEQKNKKLIKDSAPKKIQSIIEEESSKSFPENELISNDNTLESAATNEENLKETLLIEKITTEQALPCDDNSLDKASLTIEPSDSSFSTITDTKNIPLLPATKKIDSRLVTSLDLRPVTPLIISLRAESSEDEYDIEAKKNATKNSRSSKPTNDFEKNLDNFLKNIRTQQESSQVTKTVSSPILKTSKENNQSNISPRTSLSAVKHLPMSSQLEYEKLVRKMKILQEAKKQRQKAGTLKRTKSSSSTTDKSNEASQSSDSTNKKQVPANSVEIQKATPKESKENKPSKIDDAIGKIPLLDEAARVRLIEKTENSFLNHSKNLLESTETNIKLLEENNLDFKRRERIESKISEIEKTLVKYKNFLRVVNTRIKTNTPKIVQSQRDMIKIRNNQFRFGKICKRVGETVCGESYILPKYDETKIKTNFLNISEKTEEIHKSLNEQPFPSKQLKLLADKVKEFIPKSIENQQKPDEVIVKTQDTTNSQQKLEAKKINSGRAIIRSVSQLIAACENEELENEVEITDEIQTERAPEFYRNVKRVLEYKEPSEFKKKVKYESPLEFLKLPSSIENSKSVNQIVCPFQMEGTCNDAQCKYLHL